MVTNTLLLKRRTVRLGTAAAVPAEVLAAIRQMSGVDSASSSNRILLVEYDLRRLTFMQIEAVLRERGVPLKGGIHGLRRAVWKFTETNERASEAHPANGACCNHPPPKG